MLRYGRVDDGTMEFARAASKIKKN